jgi:hypothetical protein
MKMQQLNILAGSSFGLTKVIGIVLCLVAVGMVYVGIKVYNGFKIDFGTKANVPQEDTHIPTTAKIQNKVRTTMPDFNGQGEREIIEWTMVYEIDGEKYKQTIPDNNYTKGQIIDIKYEPDDPNDFYVYDKQAEEAAAIAAQNGEEEEISAEKNKLGLGMVALACLICAVGVALLLS